MPGAPGCGFWASPQAANLPDQHHGREHPAVLTEAGGKVSDLDRASPGIGQAGCHNRGIGKIGLLGLNPVQQLNRTITHSLARGVLLQQGTENRIAVEAGKTAPDDLRRGVDQGADPAVADQGKIQGAFLSLIFLASSPAKLTDSRFLFLSIGIPAACVTCIIMPEQVLRGQSALNCNLSGMVPGSYAHAAMESSLVSLFGFPLNLTAHLISLKYLV